MRFLRVEASGIRTALAAAVPLIVGQAIGQPFAGVTVGLGGLYLSLTDKEGSTLASLVIATILNGVAVWAGTALASHHAIALVATFAWSCAGGLASAYGEVPSQVGFVSTLAFVVALGSSVSPSLSRAALFVAGGVWGTALTQLLWMFHRATSALADPVAPVGLALRSLATRHALRLGIAATLALALFYALRLERGYWLILTVLVIVKPVFADTRTRTIQRVAGSIVGGAIAALLAATVHNAIVLDVLLVVFGVLAYSQVRHNYGVFVVFLTPFVVLMIETVQPTDWHIALTRIVDTLLGAAIALTVTYLLRPRWAAK